MDEIAFWVLIISAFALAFASGVLGRFKLLMSAFAFGIAFWVLFYFTAPSTMKYHAGHLILPLLGFWFLFSCSRVGALFGALLRRSLITELRRQTGLQRLISFFAALTLIWYADQFLPRSDGDRESQESRQADLLKPSE